MQERFDGAFSLSAGYSPNIKITFNEKFLVRTMREEIEDY
jgi:hypothetical protein